MSELSDLQAALAQALEDAQDAKEEAQANHPLVPVPSICEIPPFPETATNAQKIAALQCALTMVSDYLACIQGDPQNWASCVATVCSNFTICWNAAFGIA